MEKLRRILSIVLAAALCTGISAVPASAAPAEKSISEKEDIKNYFCIGDSIPGSGVFPDYGGCVSEVFNSDPVYDLNGYTRGYSMGSYPDLVSRFFDVDHTYRGSHCGWRVNEARILLEDNYAGDSYTREHLWRWSSENDYDTPEALYAYRDTYQAELSKADLVSVQLGSNELLGYMNYISKRCLDEQTEGTPLQQYVIDRIQKLEGKCSEYEMLCSLLELAEEIGLYTVMVETVAVEMPQVIVKFMKNYDRLIADIRSFVGKDAVIVGVGLYNPAVCPKERSVLGSAKDAVIGALEQPIFDIMNNHISVFSSANADPKFVYADVSDMDLTGTSDGSHPGQIGHAIIADSIIKAAMSVLNCRHENTHIRCAFEPTKLTLGYSGTVVCDDCGKTLGLGHYTNYGCHHDNVRSFGAIKATRFTLGYSGIQFCADCGRLLSLGHVTKYSCAHEHTAAVGAISATRFTPGFTGSTFCTDCGELLKLGRLCE